MLRVVIAVAVLGLICPALFGQATNRLAPGAPGADAHWQTAAKDGFGTSSSARSNVWFTLARGAMTEVFYPTLDTPNTQILQFIVCTGNKCFSEADDMVHSLELPDHRALSFRQVNKGAGGAFTITKTYTADPERPSILMEVNFASSNNSYELYLYYDPSLNNSGMHDTGWQSRQSLLSQDGNVCSALISDSGFAETSSGFLDTSGGVTQLQTDRGLIERYERAENGNVVQIARLNHSKRFTVILAFGGNAGEAYANAYLSLNKGFARAQREYVLGWHQYLSSLRPVAPRFQPQYQMAAMVLKGLEDKTHPGAIIASPSNPWGAGPNANEPNTTGYHAVWPRDLYHCATAFLAMGDRMAAVRALNYLFKTQQKKDGSFPQNTRVDGRAIGGAVQLDQTAFPILLAYQLFRTDRDTWVKHIKPAADFILSLGPATEQERWEEESGYSPSTIAAEIAGLICAARIAELNSDQRSAKQYLRTADEWGTRVQSWTATHRGPYASTPYYLRVTANGDPNEGSKIEINSGGGLHDEREIVDAGFLELVRLGIKRVDDSMVVRSIAITDGLLKVRTPHGDAWYRYNHDGYGESEDGGPYDGRTGKGRLWTLLTGERGEYELARGDVANAVKLLNTLQAFANEGMMIPEQIWDHRESPTTNLRFGEGTGSATPLGWSMAQFIRLAVSLGKGENVETPDVVAMRYQRAGQPKRKFQR